MSRILPLAALLSLSAGCAVSPYHSELSNDYSNSPFADGQWYQQLIGQTPSPAITAPAQFGVIGTELAKSLEYAVADVNAASQLYDFSLTVETDLVPVSGQYGAQLNAKFDLVTEDSRKHFYKPGEYMISSVAGHGYVTAITEIIKATQRRFGDQYELLILADFIGSSDAIPIQKARYHNQFGAITIPKHELLINGQQPAQDFHLSPDQALTNSDLAVLRAYSMHQHFLARDPAMLGLIEQSRFLASTEQGIGKQFRFAEVVIKIKQRPLMITQNLI